MVSTLVAPDRDSDSGSGVQGNKEQPCFMAGLVGIQSFSDTFFFTLKDPTWKKNIIFHQSQSPYCPWLFEVQTTVQTHDVVAVMAIRLQAVAAGHHCEAAASLQTRADQNTHLFKSLTSNKIHEIVS